MKTILTEWGEIPLNDWREMKLKYAEWCASFARTWYRVWMWTAAFWAAVGIGFAVYSISEIHKGNLWAVVLLLIPAMLVYAVKLSINGGNAVRTEFLLKRQEIVDEVAAVMRTFK